MLRSTEEAIPPLIRMGHLMAFTEFLSLQRVSFERYLHRSGLPLLCQESDCLVPHSRVWAFFDDMAAAESPILGWLVGKHVGGRNLNPELLARMEAASTLYQALQLLFARLRTETTDIQMGLHELVDDVLVFMCYPGRREDPGYHQAQAYQIGVILDVIRHFVGHSWSPPVIGIESGDYPTGLQEHFPKTRILIQRKFGYIQVPCQLLHHNARPTSGILNITDRPDFIDALQALLKSYLPDGYLPAKRAAQLIEVSERTLARRLEAHGLTYGMLVDDIRFNLATERLKEPGITPLEVANSIGISDQSNFNRMFRRMSGMTPMQFRKTMLH
jgi:AraC-like DNA-binding protein